MKRRLYRIGLVLVLVLICVWMAIIGRGHTVYFDNVTLEYEGETYSAPYRVDVYVNGERVAKLNAKDRGMATWIGQDFKMDLEITVEKGGDKTERSVKVKLPYQLDGIILNLPGLLSDLPMEAIQSEFVPLVVAESEDVELPSEEGALDEFGDF